MKPSRGVSFLAALSFVGAWAIPATARAACQGRPSDPDGVVGYAYGSAEVKTYDTAKVRVHYATSGVHAPKLATTRADGAPDTVAFAGDTAEGALTRYGAMGYTMPPSDASCASNGGDGRLDVYLVHFTAADGSTFIESCDGRACSSFVLCEATFDSHGYSSAEEGFRTVVSHELFHAVQNAYDAEIDRFWAEGTAQWAMKTLHPDLADFERQLPAFFAEPNRSLDTAPSGVTAGYLYGSAVWPLFLATKYGDDTIREILEEEGTGGTDGIEALVATDSVLGRKGASLAEAFPVFAAWNVATKNHAGSGGYANAASYPGVAVTPLTDGASDISSGMGYFAYEASLASRSRISLDTDPSRNVGLVIPLRDGKADLDALVPLPADVEGGALVVVAGITTKKTDAPFTLHVETLAVSDPDPGSNTPPASNGDANAAGSDDGGCSMSPPRSGALGSEAQRWSCVLALGLVAVAGVVRRRRANVGTSSPVRSNGACEARRP